jgi:S1-C subfamily serine protease
VEPGSVAALAELRAGDIVTRAGTQSSPAPAQVARAYDALPPGGALLAAVTRGGEHLVVALVKP